MNVKEAERLGREAVELGWDNVEREGHYVTACIWVELPDGEPLCIPDFTHEATALATISWVRIECENRWPGCEVGVNWLKDGTVEVTVDREVDYHPGWDPCIELVGPTIAHAALATVRKAKEAGA